MIHSILRNSLGLASVLLSTMMWAQCEADHNVIVTNFEFIPSSLTVVPGETVAFINIERLAEEGKLVVAGPFYDVPREHGSWRGLFLLNTADTAEARGWVDQDPAVRAGVFDVVLAPWYSSGALQAVQGLHQGLQASE